MKLTLVSSEPREGDARSFIFRPDSPVTWQPGQYIHYTLPHDGADERGLERWFTISSAPAEGFIMITTRLNMGRSSTFKSALQQLQPGDTIEADAPEGDFVVGDPDRHYLFVAGGIGITPFRSILKQADVDGRKLHVHLLYANRDDNLVFRDELEQFAAHNPNFRVDYVISPDRLDSERLSTAIAQIDNPFVYISGPEPMVEALTADVEALGVDKASIQSDYFPGYPAV